MGINNKLINTIIDVGDEGWVDDNWNDLSIFKESNYRKEKLFDKFNNKEQLK